MSTENIVVNVTRARSGSRSLEPLTKEVECKACQRIYTDPRNLSCNHAFCFTCIVTAAKHEDRGWTIQCPVCSAVTRTIGDLKESLPRNEDLASESEIVKDYMTADENPTTPSKADAEGTLLESKESPTAENEVDEWFDDVDVDHDGKINMSELAAALVNNDWTPFREKTVRDLFSMVDTDHNGLIDRQEFRDLQLRVMFWRKVFDKNDRDKNGVIDEGELKMALDSLGIHLTAKEFSGIRTVYFPHASMKLDDFIECCVYLRSVL
eukprot:CAMPEP_0196660128 /NCGR_PEP_ID=MMETSP1086-20130531/38224_1 /TAXON_ID=77921 /ORGANISM="Cyanoptyche  gloeocystis , Strain SAG4.97" /LENGTH=265 /DNA_ID=CAMNT_0041994389 /DNA_START=18 /DNA_END=815 /DNA_ORIENTATION=+